MDIGYKKGYSAAIFHTIITGLSFLFGKIALESSNPLDILAYRYAVAFLGVIIFFIFKPVKLNYTKENIFKILPLTILYPLLFFSFQTFGLQYTSSSEAGIFLAMVPILTLIMADIFLKEKTTLLQKISILLSVIGVIYITLMKGSNLGFSNIKGIVFLIISTLAYSGYNVLARNLTKEFTSIELSYMMITISFISFNLLSIIRNLLYGTISNYFLPLQNLRFTIAIIYLGILSSLISSLLSNYALSKIKASEMSVFANLGTVISILAGVIFLKEKVFYYHIIGSILIIGGVLGTNFLDKIVLKDIQDALKK
ncbi:MAG TPA: DMT family transporter [Eubacteriaceae bacterium]|nr:DMT family transporter [Eubacteriaceae bacterium]